MVLLYHQHYPPLGLDEGIGVATNHRIYLIGGDGLPILADVQAVAVDHLRYLLGAHPSALAGQAVEYGFFDFHLFFIIFPQIYANLLIFSFDGIFQSKNIL